MQIHMDLVTLALLLGHAAAAPHILFYVVDDLGWSGAARDCMRVACCVGIAMIRREFKRFATGNSLQHAIKLIRLE